MRVKKLKNHLIVNYKLSIINYFSYLYADKIHR